MDNRTRRNRTADPHPFKVGDRVRVRLGVEDCLGTIVEDRGFLGAGGRRLFGIEVEFDPPTLTYIELPEEEIAAAD